MSTALTAFYPWVHMECPGVPAPVLADAVIRGAREFCKDTYCTDYETTITTADGTRDYAVSVPAYTELVSVKFIKDEGTSLTPMTVAELDDAEPSITTVAGDFIVGRTYTIVTVGTTSFTAIGAASNTVGVVFTATGVGSGTGSAAYTGTGGVATRYAVISTNPKTVRFYPTPDDVRVLDVKHVVIPMLSATVVDTRLYDWYREGVVLHALYCLQDQTGKPWSEPSEAAVNLRKYTQFVMQTTHAENLAFASKPMMVQMRPFA